MSIRTLFKSLAILGLALSIPLTANAANEEKFNVVSNWKGKDITIPGKLYLPSDSTNLPVVVFLHDSGGIDDHHIWWAKKLMSFGYAVAMPDSFGPRNIGNLSGNAMALPTPARLNDLYATVAYLKTHPKLNHDKIAYMGISHGAIVAARAAQEGTWQRFGSIPNVKAAISIYGYCMPEALDHPTIPLLMIVGEQDDFYDINDCKVMPNRIKTPYSQNLTMLMLPNTTHSFDRQGNNRSVFWPGGYEGKIAMRTMKYNSESTKKTLESVNNFLQQNMH